MRMLSVVILTLFLGACSGGSGNPLESNKFCEMIAGKKYCYDKCENNGDCPSGFICEVVKGKQKACFGEIRK